MFLRKKGGTSGNSLEWQIRNTFNAHFLTLETTQGGIPKSEKTGLSNEGEGGPLYAEKGREGKNRFIKGRGKFLAKSMVIHRP